MAEYSEREASQIALAAAKEAVRETMTEMFSLLGVNVANFDSMQGLRDDLAFVRSLRHGATKAGGRFFLTIVSLIAGAVAIGMWEWLRSALHIGL